MLHKCHFRIRNDLSRAMFLNIEHEGEVVELSHGDQVDVFGTHTELPVMIEMTSYEGDPLLTVFPGDGGLWVEKGGINVFDLI